MENQDAVPKQSQHYVPQFLLQNFSHPFQTDAEDATPPASQDGSPQRKDQTKIRRGELVVNRVDLSSETAFITETPMKSVFGHFDMFQKTNLSRNQQNRIKQKLSRLESDASAIFRRMLTAFTAGDQGLWLTREERNLVRKFLFITKYRGSAMYKRYCHENMATYVDEDKEHLQTYMKQKGFSRPSDVWLDNLEKFIDVQMDVGMNWGQQLLERTYAIDANWAFMDCQASYMAICTPSASDAEFFISGNCYEIFEGAQQFHVDSESGKSTYIQGSIFHEFAPVSPRLLIVLRSPLFSCSEEDADAQVKADREMWRFMHEAQFGRLSETLLDDLPVSKARNNYSEVVNGVLRPVHGMAGPSHQRRHSFFFKFFPLETTHVNRINGVFLASASSCSSLVFQSKTAFRASLAWFMANSKYFPKYAGYNNSIELGCLKKFSALLTQLDMKNRPLGKGTPSMREAVENIPDGNDATPFMQVYQMLGGSKETLVKDMDQAARMFNLRIKIDVWSRGIDEQVRQRNRDALIEHFLTMPRRRVWLYLKRWKLTSLLHEGTAQRGHMNNSPVEGPEDVIARACKVIKPDRLNQLMYWAAGNHIAKTRPPGFDPWAPITADSRGAQQFAMLNEFAFSSIPQIEHFASIGSSGALALIDEYMSLAQLPLWTRDPFLEMSTRMIVKSHFRRLLSGDLEGQALDALAEVFFELVYPAQYFNLNAQLSNVNKKADLPFTILSDQQVSKVSAHASDNDRGRQNARLLKAE
ncbi:hypothetical protein E4U43_005246 [Claviceps pusilla]|uniref:DUF4238 domain-containing protein n=1 Tax=Claviceps pusilla TaxID=123648 RepID=A0A9P7NGW8_9HYPO|nr:hypothetical protein E4U43_005246 [Claviceps pusilla]